MLVINFNDKMDNLLLIIELIGLYNKDKMYDCFYMLLLVVFCSNYIRVYRLCMLVSLYHMTNLFIFCPFTSLLLESKLYIKKYILMKFDIKYKL